VAALAVTAVLVRPAESRDRPSIGPESPETLHVPFVAQSEALCGGAAAAMVIRYWGGRGIHAEDFAPLLTSPDGIAAGVLARAVRDRGWRAWVVALGPDDVRHHLERRRPVILLIEDRPGRHHYVVVTAWSGGRVRFHDPARGADRERDEAAFTGAWSRASGAALLILPSAVPGPAPAVVAPVSSAISQPMSPAVPAPQLDRPCRTLVDEGVRLARGGDLEAADRVLGTARRECPGTPAPPREMAGVRFLQRRWSEAAALAAAALEIDPGDRLARETLAASQMLEGDEAAALETWNALGAPRVDLVRIDGLSRTAHQVVAGVIGIDADAVLTSDRLQRARRRLHAWNGATAARIGFVPVADGLVDIDAVAVERDRRVLDPWRAAALAVRAAVEHDAWLALPGRSSAGESWELAFRFQPARRAIRAAFATPRFAGIVAEWRVEAAWEEDVRDERRSAALAYADWIAADWRVEGSLSLDRWEERVPAVGWRSAIERRLAGDRVALRVEGATWLPLGGDSRFSQFSGMTSWRSTREQAGFVWSSRAVVAGASDSAPRMLWPAAGSSQSLSALLRAHPPYDGVRDGVRGQRLAAASVEGQRWWASGPLLRLGVAAFVDTAALKRAGYVAVGLGARIGLPAARGTLRFDLARGLSDRAVAFSVGWTPRL
jgi:hypothetical protein